MVCGVRTPFVSTFRAENHSTHFRREEHFADTHSISSIAQTLTALARGHFRIEGGQLSQDTLSFCLELLKGEKVGGEMLFVGNNSGIEFLQTSSKYRSLCVVGSHRKRLSILI